MPSSKPEQNLLQKFQSPKFEIINVKKKMRKEKKWKEGKLVCEEQTFE